MLLQRLVIAVMAVIGLVIETALLCFFRGSSK